MSSQVQGGLCERPGHIEVQGDQAQRKQKHGRDNDDHIRQASFSCKAGVPGGLHKQTSTSGMQPFRKNSGIGVAETGESVTPGRIGKRKRWDSQRASSSQHQSGRYQDRSQPYDAD